MNVVTETTTAIRIQRAIILLDHLLAHVILASLEMEPFAKVCSKFAEKDLPIDLIHSYHFVN